MLIPCNFNSMQRDLKNIINVNLMITTLGAWKQLILKGAKLRQYAYKTYIRNVKRCNRVIYKHFTGKLLMVSIFNILQVLFL